MVCVGSRNVTGAATSVHLGECPHFTWPGVNQNKGQHLTPPTKITSFCPAARQAGPGHPSVSIPVFSWRQGEGEVKVVSALTGRSGIPV